MESCGGSRSITARVFVISPLREDRVDRVDRAQGELTYRMTQVLTGHGCFGEYLYRIKRERTTQCHHCTEVRDTAQHTLAECQEWEGLRRVLVDKVVPDLSLPPRNEDDWQQRVLEGGCLLLRTSHVAEGGC